MRWVARLLLPLLTPMRHAAWLLLPLLAVACYPNPNDLRDNGSAQAGSSGTTGAAGTTGSAGATGCQQPGDACTTNGQCCQTGTNVSRGAFCIMDDGVCHAKCSTGTDCSSGCCVAVTGQSLGACAAASNCARAVGDPCTSNAQCASGSCTGWCEAACSAASPTCPASASSLFNAEGFPNWCEATATKGDLCFPGCGSDADCTVYGTGLTCKSFTSVDGLVEKVCSG